ncbi:hypothetical protein NPIL_598701 [Nephila pilipes]|uniref:Uncharacterized protein n=1 Tax=Nephila pilipes TaxID=299642 RepID=A0A8X6N5W9_NEPPI|nr:hypothetical protein NPIL_598701 [Nephila pilipes]
MDLFAIDLAPIDHEQRLYGLLLQDRRSNKNNSMLKLRQASNDPNRSLTFCGKSAVDIDNSISFNCRKMSGQGYRDSSSRPR